MSVTPEGAPVRPGYIRDASGLYYRVGGGMGQLEADARYASNSYVDNSHAGRNRIINGDFRVNQRGFISTSTVYAYGFDRWQGTFVGGTTTYSAGTPVMGELPESARAFARLATSGQAAAGDWANITQRIEFVRTLSGKTVTVSFWAKALSGTPKVAVSLTQHFGTGGSPSANIDIHVGQVVLSTSWTRYSLTVSLPSCLGKFLGTSNTDQLALTLWTSAGSSYNTPSGSLGIQNTTIDIWGVQLEEGLVATTFEQKSYADELQACQRYYQLINTPGTETMFGTIAFISTTQLYFWGWGLPVAMRAIPSLSLYNLYGFIPGIGSFLLSPSVPVNFSSPSVLAFAANKASGTWTVGQWGCLISMTGQAGWIELLAEL